MKDFLWKVSAFLFFVILYDKPLHSHTGISINKNVLINKMFFITANVGTEVCYKRIFAERQTIEWKNAVGPFLRELKLKPETN